MLFDDASNDRFELRFELAEVLGRGRFGIVRACEDKQTGESYAVKIVDKRKHSDVEQMVSEVAVLRQLKHPNLPAFVELFESEQYVYLVQERVRGEEVFSRIEAQGPLPEDVARPVLAQLLDALTYLHDDLSLIHRDLKPEHILYSNRNFVLPVKLRMMRRETRRSGGTLRCISPRMRTYNSRLWRCMSLRQGHQAH
eukprot:m.51839 g.51839  ORF g.51839 m.51839 type:complete len:197 (+) comp6642_c0_seq1:58-648(+)